MRFVTFCGDVISIGENLHREGCNSYVVEVKKRTTMAGGAYFDRNFFKRIFFNDF
jgi:hypothetical protein